MKYISPPVLSINLSASLSSSSSSLSHRVARTGSASEKLMLSRPRALNGHIQYNITIENAVCIYIYIYIYIYICYVCRPIFVEVHVPTDMQWLVHFNDYRPTYRSNIFGIWRRK